MNDILQRNRDHAPQWELRSETSKLKGKPIEVYYVGPIGNPYGYASFILASPASEFLKRMNKHESTPRNAPTRAMAKSNE